MLLAIPGVCGAGQFEQVLQPGWTNQSCYSWSVSWGDYDGDGYPDLHLCNTTLSWGGYADFVYHNNGANTNAGPFTRMTTNELGEVVGDVATSYNATWIDADNDGLLDLAVIRTPGDGSSAPVASRLYLNRGGGKLTSVPAGAWTLPTYAFGGTWGDYDNDGWLDFYELSAYSMSWPYIRTNRLFRGRADLSFEEIKDSPISTTRVQFANCSRWSDYDNDGDVDLVVVNINDPISFFQNHGHGNFSRVTNAVTTRLDGYNSAWGDYDNDGDLDLLILGGGRSLLYRNNYPDDFTIAADLHETGGYPALADYDNDGFLDILVTRGQDSPMRNSLFHNNGDGTFTSVSDAMTITGRWMGGAWGDYDNDGALDLLICSSTGANKLFHNLGNTNHWIKFKLRGTVSNGAAIGAKVRVKATIRGQTVWQMREVQSGAVTQDDMRPTFGLGDATNVELVRIEWPSGNVQELVNLMPDRIFNVTETVRINPARPTVSLGGSITLTNVTAVVSYQWQLDGTNLVGKTARTLGLTNLTVADAGRYSVVVTLNNGEIQTNFTYLDVDTRFTKLTAGPAVTDREATFGASWVDIDDDGDIDLVAFNGYDVPTRQYNAVYRNDGRSQFTRVTGSEAGDLVTMPGNWLAGVWGDIDNDGDVDCVVCDYYRYPNLPMNVFLNDGRGILEIASNAGALGSLKPSGFAALADHDNDGWLDVFVGCAWMDGGVRNNRLFRGVGNGEFVQVTTGPIVQDSFIGTEAQAWGDYDGDGDLDLIVTDPHAWWRNHNASPVFLYRNEGGGRFTRITDGVLAQTKGSVLLPAWADYDNDGRLDLFLTEYDGASRLFHNEGNGQFSSLTIQTGPATGYPAWGDFDNDGDLDLFLTTGQANAQTNMFFLNQGGQLVRHAAGSLTAEAGRGTTCLWGDYDDDGFLDLFIGRGYDEANSLFHNNGNANHWLMADLRGTDSNRSAIGARIRVRAIIGGRAVWQLREISGGNRCQGDPRAHFGLGDATNATTLRIEWPSGTIQEMNNVAANQILTILEPRRPVLVLRVSGSGVNGSLSADPNSTYQVQISADLTTWSDQGTVTTDAQGVGSWSDSGAVGVSHRFYRVRGL